MSQLEQLYGWRHKLLVALGAAVAGTLVVAAWFYDRSGPGAPRVLTAVALFAGALVVLVLSLMDRHTTARIDAVADEKGGDGGMLAALYGIAIVGLLGLGLGALTIDYGTITPGTTTTTTTKKADKPKTSTPNAQKTTTSVPASTTVVP